MKRILVVLDGSPFAEQILERLDAEQKRQCEQAEKYLEQMADRLRARSLTVRTRVVVEEQPAVGILHEAQKDDADLIALATHGRRGLSSAVSPTKCWAAAGCHHTFGPPNEYNVLWCRRQGAARRPATSVAATAEGWLSQAERPKRALFKE